MKTVPEIYSIMIARAQRADDLSEDKTLPRSQQTFHAGRREAYLQMIALINGGEVADIRTGILGSSRKRKKDDVTVVPSAFFDELISSLEGPVVHNKNLVDAARKYREQSGK